jgi:hypothetical protein
MLKAVSKFTLQAAFLNKTNKENIFMKKQFFAIAAIGMASAGALCAQSLYDIAPDESEKDSLPLTWTVGANIGLDDNPTPLFSALIGEDQSLYGQAYVGATLLNNQPTSTTAFGAQLGVIHYFDNLSILGNDVDDSSFTASLYLNHTERLSERLRVVSRNSFAYELEPDYSYGFQSDRAVGNYTRWFTDNSVGYRWSERLATYTGFRLSDLSYDDSSFSYRDLSTTSFSNSFRYQLSELTVGTFNYRYSESDGSSQVTDSTNHFYTLGLENRFSPRALGVVRAGIQDREVDGGTSGTSPFLEGTLRIKANEQLSYRAYARFGVEDYGRMLRSGLTTAVYSGTESLRLGFSSDYLVSQDLTLSVGLNYIDSTYDDLMRVAAPVGVQVPRSLNEELVNAYVGFGYKLNDSMTLSGRYNFEDHSSDNASRGYERNRISLGVSTQF